MAYKIAETKHLLSIMELGGYPDFNALYQEQGFKVARSFFISYRNLLPH